MAVLTQASTFSIPVNTLLFRTEGLRVGIVKGGKVVLPSVTRYKGGVTSYLEVTTAESAPLGNEVTAVNILGRRMGPLNPARAARMLRQSGRQQWPTLSRIILLLLCVHILSASAPPTQSTQRFCHFHPSPSIRRLAHSIGLLSDATFHVCSIFNWFLMLALILLERESEIDSSVTSAVQPDSTDDGGSAAPLTARCGTTRPGGTIFRRGIILLDQTVIQS